MSFDDQQTGPLGRTVELYEFFQAGTFTRYTSAANDQVDGGDTYAVLPGLRRTAPVQGNEANSGEIQITVPPTIDLAQQFRGTLPSNFPTLTIYKRHLNDPALQLFAYWKGTIVNCAFKDQMAVLYGQPSTRVFQRPIPRAVFSGLCNHQLFDTGCGVSRANYTFTGTVVGLSADGTTLTIDGLRDGAVAINTAQSGTQTAQELDDYWQRGLVATKTSPAEFRMVVETDVGGDPNTVRINIPFRDLEAGQQVDVSAGCPHSVTACADKFNNEDRFGGFPYVPTVNPFQVELDSGLSNNNAGSSTGGPRRGAFF